MSNKLIKYILGLLFLIQASIALIPSVVWFIQDELTQMQVFKQYYWVWFILIPNAFLIFYLLEKREN